MKVQNRDAPANLFTPSSDLSSLPPSVSSDQGEIEETEVRAKVSPTSPLSFPLFSAEIGHDPQASATFENSVIEPQNGNQINNAAWTPIATTTEPKRSRQKPPKPVKYKPWTREWQEEINKKLYPPKKTKNTKTTKKKSNSNSLSSLSPEYITKNNAFPP